MRHAFGLAFPKNHSMTSFYRVRAQVARAPSESGGRQQLSLSENVGRRGEEAHGILETFGICLALTWFRMFIHFPRLERRGDPSLLQAEDEGNPGQNTLFTFRQHQRSHFSRIPVSIRFIVLVEGARWLFQLCWDANTFA